MTSVRVRSAAFSSAPWTSALITLLIIVEECWASLSIDEVSSNLNLNLFGDGSDEFSLRTGDVEGGGGALLIGGITNWDTGFKLKYNSLLSSHCLVMLKFSPLHALLLSLRLVNSLKFPLHDPTKRNVANALTAKLRMIKAQRHQLSANWTSANVWSFALTRSRMLNNSLHLLTSGSSAACTLSTVEGMNEGGEASVDGFFSWTHVSHALFLLICTLHHVRDHHL